MASCYIKLDSYIYTKYASKGLNGSMKSINIGFFTYKFMSNNIGDDVQTLAMIGMLKNMEQFHSMKFPKEFSEYNCIINPKADISINMIPLNRDNLSAVEPTINNIIVIMNGWFMHRMDSDKGRSKFTGLQKKKLFDNNIDWPPPPNIKPVFISFHLHNRLMLDDMYIQYYKDNEPIGCRDKSTVRRLRDKNVNAYLSGCLSLTLDNIHKMENDGKEYYVDIPVSNNTNGIYITHQKWQYALMEYTQRFPIAQKLLDRYAKAKSVTTNRIHAMLPCLAFGTKVDFYLKKQNDIRLEGILELINDKELLYETITGLKEHFKKRVWVAVEGNY